MKLKQQQKLPPEQLRLTVPGEVMQHLTLYQRYQTEVEHTTWELKELATEILRAFLEEGDRKFLLWQRQQRNGEGRKPGAAEVGEGVEGGGMDKASMSTRLRDA